MNCGPIDPLGAPTRREFLKLLGAGAVSASLPGLVSCGRSATSRRPNLVFVLCDDHRHDALGCAGHPWVRTPHLDRLADEGVHFTNAFVTTSLCSPSRASFLNGCYAHTHGVVRNELNDPPVDLATFPQLLQAAGYETAFIGKWHLARKSSPRPGFDHWVSFNGQGDYQRNTLNVDGEWVLSRKYITDELTERALAFLERERDRPFLLVLSHKALHTPVQPAARHAGLYRDVRVHSRDRREDALNDKPDWGGRQQRFANWQEYIRNYMRCLAAVDEGLGRILQALADRGVLEDTAVIYAGDNGYLQGEHGGLWDKRAAYEPSLRIPLLMRYPRLARAATRSAELVLNIDLAPTVLALAGVSIPATIQGRSWLGLLAGEAGRESFLYEYFQELGRVPTLLAVRTRRWKYITYPATGPGGESETRLTSELYDLQQDPWELTNLFGDARHAGTVARMRQELARLQAETAFRFPAS